MMKFLFDTDALISACMNSDGVPRLALSRSILFHETCISQSSLDELNDTFELKIPQRLNDLKMFLDLFLPNVRIIPIPGEKIDLEKKIHDEYDQLILQAALSAGVDVIISNDKDFLESGIKAPVILNPSQSLYVDSDGEIPEFDGNIPIVEDEDAMRAMRALRDIGEYMAKEHVAESLGLYTEEDIVKMCKEIRHEIWKERHSENSV